MNARRGNGRWKHYEITLFPDITSPTDPTPERPNGLIPLTHLATIRGLPADQRNVYMERYRVADDLEWEDAILEAIGATLQISERGAQIIRVRSATERVANRQESGGE